MTKIEGTIERVIYYNEDNSYTIAAFFIDPKMRKELPVDSDILSSTITIIGSFDRKPIEDEELALEGEFIVDKKYGLQFKVSSFKRKKIDSVIGLINFFSSELFPGVGVKTAKEIVEKLGIDAIDKIKEDEHVLDSIKMTNVVKHNIISTLKSEEGNEHAVMFLLNLGLSLSVSTKIIQTFPDEDVVELIKENPYILIDKVERIGFKRADKIALELGISKDNHYRIHYLIIYLLNELLYSSGNSYIYKKDLYDFLCKYLEEYLDYEVFMNHLDALVSKGSIFIDTDEAGNERIFDYNGYNEEIDLAMEVARFIKNKRAKKSKEYSEEDIDKAFEIVASKTKIDYNPEQIEAIKSSFSSPMVIITGGPGTGKTTIVKAIVEMYLLLNASSPTLATHIGIVAPTGRAAKRLNEATQMPTSTIHRFLGFSGDGYFEYGKYNKTNSRLIIVDEASMMDTSIASRLIVSSNDEARIIIVGDVDQLPSVGPGQVLKDLIDTNLIKTIFLRKIHRQDSTSSIISLAHSINNGILPNDILDKKDDRNFIKCSNDVLPNLVCELYEKALNKNKTIQDIQILIPMYKGTCGINNINKLIQEKINPSDSNKKEYNHNGRIFRVNDKVIQLINRADKGIMNGDMGYIESITYEDSKFKSLKVVFDTLKVSYELEELDDLTLAYAVSIHKAQGSEFDLVILPITHSYYVMLNKKLIYTAVTRAKKTLIFIGNKDALGLGIRIIKGSRKTILKEKILELVANKKKKPISIKDAINNYDSIDDTSDEFDINDLGEGEIKL